MDSMFYSPSTGGFYTVSIHGPHIPADAVAVGDADYDALMMAQSRGQIIQPNRDGYPIAVDPPVPVPTAQSVKSEAARRLASTDWYAIRKSDTGEDIPDAVVTYRAAVRARSGEIEIMDPIPADYGADERWPTLPPETTL